MIRNEMLKITMYYLPKKSNENARISMLKEGISHFMILSLCFCKSIQNREKFRVFSMWTAKSNAHQSDISANYCTWKCTITCPYCRPIKQVTIAITELRSPSGSKGAWHHEGASGRSGPFCGEFILHCFDRA
jgi:hypothetical protein